MEIADQHETSISEEEEEVESSFSSKSRLMIAKEKGIEKELAKMRRI